MEECTRDEPRHFISCDTQARYYCVVPWLRRAFLIGLAIAFVAGLAWLWLESRTQRSVTFEASAFARWPIVVSNGTDPWIVALAPPEAVMATLTKEATRRAGRPLFAPAHPGMPLVLRTEFDEALQGVYGTDSVLRMARDAGVDATHLQPVCLAHRVSDGPSGRAEIYFVPFESPEFWQLRTDLTPTEPEHAGIGVYDPSSLTPILVVGATDASFDRWWPLRFNPAEDCVGVVETTASAQK